MYFSPTIQIQKCTGFKISAFLRCLDDLQICSSNVFFINNPNPDPDKKLKLKPDPDPNKIISDPKHWQKLQIPIYHLKVMGGICLMRSHTDENYHF
jgi:hypothetical protein